MLFTKRRIIQSLLYQKEPQLQEKFPEKFPENFHFLFDNKKLPDIIVKRAGAVIPLRETGGLEPARLRPFAACGLSMPAESSEGKPGKAGIREF